MKDNWITLSDQSPEPEDFYLVFANNTINFFYYGINNKEELVWWHHGEQIRPHLLPTHWQALPPRPLPYKMP